ncbi:hypothetical protein D3C87_1911820 [compost metagenome]
MLNLALIWLNLVRVPSGIGDKTSLACPNLSQTVSIIVFASATLAVLAARIDVTFTGVDVKFIADVKVDVIKLAGGYQPISATVPVLALILSLPI